MFKWAWTPCGWELFIFVGVGSGIFGISEMQPLRNLLDHQAPLLPLPGNRAQLYRTFRCLEPHLPRMVLATLPSIWQANPEASLAFEFHHPSGSGCSKAERMNLLAQELGDKVPATALTIVLPPRTIAELSPVW